MSMSRTSQDSPLKSPSEKQLEGKEMSPDPPQKQTYTILASRGECQFHLQAGSTHLLATWF